MESKPTNDLNEPVVITDTIPSGGTWKESKWLILIEMAIVAMVFALDISGHLFLSKTPYLFLLGWASLRLRNLRWKNVGLARFKSWPTMILLGVVAGIGLECLDLLVTHPLLEKITKQAPDLSDFKSIEGNLTNLLIGLVFVWIFAAFGEEMVWRGYILNRIAELGNGTRTAYVVSLIVLSAVFGSAHLYQGMTGVVQESLSGLWLGLIYLACGRNLAVPIIAHGMTDTLDFLLIYWGKYPGL